MKRLYRWLGGSGTQSRRSLGKSKGSWNSRDEAWVLLKTSPTSWQIPATAHWSGGGGVNLSALKGTADCEQVDKEKLLQLITQPSDKSIAGLCISNQGWPKTTELWKRIQTGETHNNCQTLLVGKEAVNTMAECFWLWTAVYQWESQKHRFRQPDTRQR